MVLNESRFNIDLVAARTLVVRLGRALGLGGRPFNVCFVEDERIAELNREFRGKRAATDVLSFAWQDSGSSAPSAPGATGTGGVDLDGFLGDVVISVKTARRNAAAEGHALSREISWLILHGLLHLLGMDHEKDQGEMAAMEYDLRARLCLDCGARKVGKTQVVEKRRVRQQPTRKPRGLLYRKTAA